MKNVNAYCSSSYELSQLQGMQIYFVHRTNVIYNVNFANSSILKTTQQVTAEAVALPLTSRQFNPN